MMAKTHEFSVLNGYLAAIGNRNSSSKNGKMAHEPIVINAGIRNVSPKTKVKTIDSAITLN
jgi:hypothetical protein